MKQIPINIPIIGEQEKKEALKVLETGYLTNKAGLGPMVGKFEKKFSEYIGCKYCIAVNSGTSALHAILLALDLKPEDEVIVPSFTFVATASMILHVNATPVFVDIEPDIFTLDPKKVEEAVNKNTKAIIPVHLFGHPADMDPILEIAEKNDLYVIEDTCQAHGAEYKRKKVGNISDAGFFSFYPSKNMTTGEGGMITTDNEEIANKIRMIINHGEKETYNTIRLGHNFRMPEINAAIGKVQLKRLPKFIEKRTKNADFFTSNLEEIVEFQTPKVREFAKHCWYMYSILYENENRDEFVKELNAASIGAGVYYKKPLHLMPLFQNSRAKKFDLKTTQMTAQKIFSIPVHPKLTDEDLQYIYNEIKEIKKD
ncbi:MAG: aminotransferase class I/II-fold pyridoxal phosphate-dependent enzyme [Candidatus Lokiarchaeota archaeon]|nr:aminotransferase class I/II-fold pyridoxal phosphate-dependent enzyme [Candidatus Lokiarchaeota archaeon]